MELGDARKLRLVYANARAMGAHLDLSDRFDGFPFIAPLLFDVPG